MDNFLQSLGKNAQAFPSYLKSVIQGQPTYNPTTNQIQNTYRGEPVIPFLKDNPRYQTAASNDPKYDVSRKAAALTYPVIYGLPMGLIQRSKFVGQDIQNNVSQNSPKISMIPEAQASNGQGTSMSNLPDMALDFVKKLFTRKPGEFGKYDPGSLYGQFEELPKDPRERQKALREFYLNSARDVAFMGDVKAVPGASQLLPQTVDEARNLAKNYRTGIEPMAQMYANKVKNGVTTLDNVFNEIFGDGTNTPRYAPDLLHRIQGLVQGGGADLLYDMEQSYKNGDTDTFKKIGQFIINNAKQFSPDVVDNVRRTLNAL